MPCHAGEGRGGRGVAVPGWLAGRLGGSTSCGLATSLPAQLASRLHVCLGASKRALLAYRSR